MSAAVNYLGATYSSCVPVTITLEGIAFVFSTISALDIFRRNIPAVLVKFRILMWVYVLSLVARSALLLIGETNAIVHTWLSVSDIAFGSPAMLYVFENFATGNAKIQPGKPPRMLRYCRRYRILLVSSALAIGIAFSARPKNIVHVVRFSTWILLCFFLVVPISKVMLDLARVLQSHRIKLQSGHKISLSQMRSLSNLGTQRNLFQVSRRLSVTREPPKLSNHQEWLAQMRRMEIQIYALIAAGVIVGTSRLVGSAISIYSLSQRPFCIWTVPKCEYGISPLGAPLYVVFILVMTWCPDAKPRRWTCSEGSQRCRTTNHGRMSSTLKGSGTISANTNGRRNSRSARGASRTRFGSTEISSARCDTDAASRRRTSASASRRRRTSSGTAPWRRTSDSFYSVAVDVEMGNFSNGGGAGEMKVAGDQVAVRNRPWTAQNTSTSISVSMDSAENNTGRWSHMMEPVEPSISSRLDETVISEKDFVLVDLTPNSRSHGMDIEENVFPKRIEYNVGSQDKRHTRSSSANHEDFFVNGRYRTSLQSAMARQPSVAATPHLPFAYGEYIPRLSNSGVKSATQISQNAASFSNNRDHAVTGGRSASSSISSSKYPKARQPSVAATPHLPSAYGEYIPRLSNSGVKSATQISQNTASLSNSREHAGSGGRSKSSSISSRLCALGESGTDFAVVVHAPPHLHPIDHERPLNGIEVMNAD